MVMSPLVLFLALFPVTSSSTDVFIFNGTISCLFGNLKKPWCWDVKAFEFDSAKEHDLVGVASGCSTEREVLYGIVGTQNGDDVKRYNFYLSLEHTCTWDQRKETIDTQLDMMDAPVGKNKTTHFERNLTVGVRPAHLASFRLVTVCSLFSHWCWRSELYETDEEDVHEADKLLSHNAGCANDQGLQLTEHLGLTQKPMEQHFMLKIRHNCTSDRKVAWLVEHVSIGEGERDGSLFKRLP